MYYVSKAFFFEKKKSILAEFNQLTQLKVLPDIQIHSNHSTLHQLARVINKKQQITTNYLHARHREGIRLNHKMSVNISIVMCNIIRSFLTNRSFAVHISNSKSVFHSVVAGVPSGSCLSPILYNYTHPTFIQHQWLFKQHCSQITPQYRYVSNENPNIIISEIHT